MAALSPFRLGTKEVFLPNFTVVLRRTKHHAPKFASFDVPLWFSKLDLRDYLFHAYDVPVLSIRSYVQQTRIRQGAIADAARPQYKRWHRPRSTKRMMVELERPFVWPAEPEDLKPWNREEIEMAEEEQAAFTEREMSSTSDAVGAADEHREAMRDQAKALLEGKVKWKPVDNRWTGTKLGR